MLKAIKFMPIKSGLWTPFSQKWLVQSRFHFYLTRSHMYVHKCLTYTLLFMLPYYLLKSKVQLALPVFECLVSFPYDKVWSRQHSIQQLFKLGSGVACSRFVTHISGGYGIWPEIKQEGKRFRRDSQRRLSQKERSLHFKFKVRALNHWSAISAQFVRQSHRRCGPPGRLRHFVFIHINNCGFNTGPFIPRPSRHKHVINKSWAKKVFTYNKGLLSLL